MATLLPLFEKHDVFSHWNVKHIHLIVLGCSTVDLQTYLSISYDGIDVVDSWGRTALMWAAWRGDSNSVSTLLDFGANSQATSLDGNSVLVYATYGGSTECLMLLLCTGANINHMSHSLVTPTTGGSRLGDNEALAKVRLVWGATIEASRQQEFTPLYVAALTNRLESLIYLLKCGADTDVEPWNCSTPLSVAISFNNHRMAEELIKRGSNLNSTSRFTVSYLMSAAVFGDERMIRLIMKARPAIDVKLKDSRGCTAQDRMKERLNSMDQLHSRKERLAAAFQQLVDVCSTEYQKAEDQQSLLRETDSESLNKEEISMMHKRAEESFDSARRDRNRVSWCRLANSSRGEEVSGSCEKAVSIASWIRNQ